MALLKSVEKKNLYRVGVLKMAPGIVGKADV